MDILIRRKKTGDISLLEMFMPEGTEKKPLVIMIHGYMCIKEIMLPQAYNLAMNGFFVVIPDAWGHGERSAPGQYDIFQSIARTTKEINLLIDHYRGNSLADAGRTGLVGYSMGGMIVFNYLAFEERRVNAAAPVIASPDWASIMGTEEAVRHFREIGVAASDDDMQKLKAAAAALQPLDRYDSVAGVPLLIQNGEADPLMDVEVVRRYCNRLKLLYANSDDLQLITYKGIGHVDTLDMNLRIAEWFRKYL